jgi:hypothetical protein
MGEAMVARAVFTLALVARAAAAAAIQVVGLEERVALALAPTQALEVLEGRRARLALPVLMVLTLAVAVAAVVVVCSITAQAQ